MIPMCRWTISIGMTSCLRKCGWVRSSPAPGRERLTYLVEYKTNKKSGWKTLKTGLSSKTSHTLDCGREALNLAAGEYVTEIRFNFGTVQAGFHEESGPVLYVTTLANLDDGYRIINRTDVGDRIGEE